MNTTLSPLSVTTFVSALSTLSLSREPGNQDFLLVSPNPCRAGGTVKFTGGGYDQRSIRDMAGRIIQASGILFRDLGFAIA
jgi:hypothetical protein